jgi:hypothetical protein
MCVKVGEKMSNCLNGKKYRVKSVVEGMVVLEAEDKLSQRLASMESLQLFYKPLRQAKKRGL